MVLHVFRRKDGTAAHASAREWHSRLKTFFHLAVNIARKFALSVPFRDHFQLTILNHKNLYAAWRLPLNEKDLPVKNKQNPKILSVTQIPIVKLDSIWDEYLQSCQ